MNRTEQTKRFKLAKQMLWSGISQVKVAQHFSMHRNWPYKIVYGKLGHSIPWPDGSIGALHAHLREKLYGKHNPFKNREGVYL